MIEHATIRQSCVTWALATALTCLFALSARAEVRVEGDENAVRVTSNHDAVADVLSALASHYNLQYRTATALDGIASASYAGPLGHVIARVLDGYNYVIKRDRGSIEVVVFGRHGEAVIPPKAAAKSESILSRWR